MVAYCDTASACSQEVVAVAWAAARAATWSTGATMTSMTLSRLVAGGTAMIGIWAGLDLG
jgi:hypothetical protein